MTNVTWPMPLVVGVRDLLKVHRPLLMLHVIGRCCMLDAHWEMLNPIGHADVTFQL